jgi:hypothetical protein
LQLQEPIGPSTLASRTFDFDLPGGVLTCRVLDATTNQPLAGIPATARAEGNGTDNHRFHGCLYRAGWSAKSAADGTLVLRCLPEGQAAVIQVGDSTHGTATIEVASPAPEGAEPIVIRLQPKAQ